MGLARRVLCVLLKMGAAVKAGYKQTEVGVIPNDWQVNDLQKSCRNTITYGIVQCGPNIDDGVPYIRVSDMNSREMNVDEMLRTSPEIAAQFSRSRVEYGDIVYALRGQIGEVRKVGSAVAGANLTQGTARISPAQHIVSDYLIWTLRSASCINQATLQAKGSTFREITLAELRQIKLPIPIKTEQKAIATALSDADEFIESLEQLLAKKRDIKHGAMQELLTGKRRLAGFSDVWNCFSLNDLFDFSGGVSASRAELGVEGFCYLHYGDIHTSKKSEINVSLEQQSLPKLKCNIKYVKPSALLEDGDVVFVDASEDDEGTSKHVVVFNPDEILFIAGLHTIVAKCKTNVLENNFKKYCFKTPEIKEQFKFFAVGTKVSGVSKSNIGKITISIPRKKEQTAIAAILSDMDTEITALETKLEKARQIKQGMMQELLTGRIRLV